MREQKHRAADCNTPLRALDSVHCRGHGSATRNLSGVIICPAKRTAVIRRTPSPQVIIRGAERKSTFGCRHVPQRQTVSVGHGMRFRTRFYGALCGHDAPVNPQREKTIAAGGAAIGGKAKQTKHPSQWAHAVLAGDALQVQVAAQSAMHVPNVSDGSSPGKKAGIAGLAAPGTQSAESHHVVLHTASAGSAGAVAMTDRT